MGCMRNEVAGEAQQALERYLGVQQQKLRQLLEQQVGGAAHLAGCLPLVPQSCSACCCLGAVGLLSACAGALQAAA
jgi:hypothetical protein